MRPALLLTLALCLATTARAQPDTEGALTIHFEQVTGARAAVSGRAGGDARVDVGEITNAAGASTVRTRFRVLVRVTSRSPTLRFARLSALLQGQASHRILIDGRLLTDVPTLVAPAVPIGRAVVHTVEIEVPADQPAGELFAPILWLAETED